MPSLFSYRIDRWMHAKLTPEPGQKTTCKLLTIRIYINNLVQEKAFYIGVLGVIPLAEDAQSVTLPLADGVALVLTSAPRGANESPLGRVELELETSDLRPLWQSAHAAALGKVSEMLVANGALAFNALSPTNLWLNLHQGTVEE